MAFEQEERKQGDAEQGEQHEAATRSGGRHGRIAERDSRGRGARSCSSGVEVRIFWWCEICKYERRPKARVSDHFAKLLIEASHHSAGIAPLAAMTSTALVTQSVKRGLLCRGSHGWCRLTTAARPSDIFSRLLQATAGYAGPISQLQYEFTQRLVKIKSTSDSSVWNFRALAITLHTITVQHV